MIVFSTIFIILYVKCKHMVRLKKIDLSKDGLNKFFSPIETTILRTLWSEGEITIAKLTEKTEIPMDSVAGTLERLVKAGYATRHVETINERDRFVYKSVFSEEETGTEITNRILDRLVDAFGLHALTNFSKYSDKK